MSRTSVVKALLGALVALALAELAFRVRDRGAFPLVNVYAADDARGVRLLPNARTTVASAAGGTFEVRTNAEGFRGADWPAPRGEDVLVVGDSQAFGLGVAEDARFPAHLERASKRTVLDASVPTWGPPEYRITVARVLAERPVATVVVALNLSNDLAELDRPNAARHTAIDGFAARVGMSPGAPSGLREEAIRRSHLAFAAWRWEKTREARAAAAPPDDLGALFAEAHERAAARAVMDSARRVSTEHRDALAEAEAERARAEADLVALAKANAGLVAWSGSIAKEWAAYVREDGDPDDAIFTLSWGYCAPPPPGFASTYRATFSGERIRRDVESLLRDFARTSRGKVARDLGAALARRDRADERLADLRAAPPPPDAPPLPPVRIEGYFRDLDALVASHGARLVVVVLPVDARNASIAAARLELSERAADEVDALARDVAEAARIAGAASLDATDVLRHEGASAFLPDGHLSPSGHAIVARALEGAI